jgi:CubicO group peptidase (beta-lactamase class C family)
VPPAGNWPGGPLAQLLQSTGTHSFMALRDGELVCEWFAPGVDANTIGRNLSVTKSVASLMVGQAVTAGRLPGVEVCVGDVLPGLADASVARLTVAQLLRMASGIRFREGVSPWSDSARTYHGTRLRERALQLRLADPVDAFFHYNDWHPLLIALVLEQVGGSSAAALLARELWEPLQAGPATMTVDRSGPSGLAHLESGLNCTCSGLAAVGQLVLQRGEWQGRMLVARSWLDRLDDPEGAWRQPAQFAYYRDMPWGRPLSTGRFAYKDFWWQHHHGAGPHDLFAMGALGAHVYVSRDTRCVLARQSQRFPRGIWWAALLRSVAEALA